MTTNTAATNDIDANPDVEIRFTNTTRGKLAEIISCVLGLEGYRAEYWRKKLDSGRVHVETFQCSAEDWDTRLHVFENHFLIGGAVLRGDAAVAAADFIKSQEAR